MLASTSGGALFFRSMCSLSFCWLLSIIDDLFSVFLMKRRRQQCHRHHHAALVSNPIPRRSPLGRRPKFYRRDEALQKIVYSIIQSSSSCSRSLSLSLSLWRVRPRNVCVHKRWLTLLFFSLQSIQRRRQRHQRPTTPALLLLPGGSCPSDEVIKMQQRRITKTLKSEDNKL